LLADLLHPSEVELAAQLEELEDPLKLLVGELLLGGHHSLGDRTVRLVADPTGPLSGFDQHATAIGWVGHAAAVWAFGRQE